MNRKQRRAAAKLASPAIQLLATAVRLHQAGQLVAAEACYRQVLAAQPNLAEGHFRLDVTRSAEWVHRRGFDFRLGAEVALMLTR